MEKNEHNSESFIRASDFVDLELPLMLQLHYSDDIGFLTMRPLHHTRPCVTFSSRAAEYCGGATEWDDDGHVVRCADEVWFADKARKLLQMLHPDPNREAAVNQRNAAVEAVKILIGVIESDPEFAGVDSTKHCVDAARQLMKLHGLWEIDTDHVQDGI